MRKIFQYIALAFIMCLSFSCIKEEGEPVLKGQFKLTVISPEKITDASDYVINVKLFREYSGERVEAELSVDQITEAGELVSSTYSVEQGNWQLTYVNVYNTEEKEIESVGIGEDDPRADLIDKVYYLPLADNIVSGEATNFSVATVDFDADIDDGGGDGGTTPDLPEGDGTKDNPYNIIQAREIQDASMAWVKGYVVGYLEYVADGDPNLISDPLTDWSTVQDGNIAIAYEMGNTEVEARINVQLSGADSDARKSLGLNSTNGGSLGKEVLVYGSLENYFGEQSGVKGVETSDHFEIIGEDGGTQDPHTSYFYDFSDGENYAAVNLNGWKTINKDAGVDRQWSYTSFDNFYYAQATAKGSITGAIETWMISPALDLDNAANKTLSIKTAKYGWEPDDTTFEIYIMDSQDPATATKTKLTVTIAGENDADHVWIESGDVDLSSFSGVQYIGFYYAGNNIEDNCSFRVADFDFGNGDGGSGGGTPGEDGDGSKDNPYTVEQALDIQDGSNAWIEGHIVGFVKSSSDVVSDWTVSGVSDTNLAVATTSGETDISKMIFIQLSGSGSDARTQLGLLSTEGASLGYNVKLSGELTNYFGHAGLKGISTADHFEIITE